MVKNKYKKEVNPVKRILISVASTVVVVGAVGGIIYHFIKAGRDQPKVSVAEGPTIQSNPGLGTPTKIYNDAQIDENAKNAAKAKQTFTSNVPTLTNTDFNGDISAFLSSDKAKADSCPVAGSKNFTKNPNTCTIENLKLARNAGVSAAELICQACPVKSLRAAGYTVGDLKNGGHSAQELKDAGYTLADLIAAGYSPAELLEAGFSPESLRAMGLSADQMAAAGCSYQDLLDSGISPELAKKAVASAEAASREALADARDSGVPAAKLLQDGVPMKKLKEAGFSARELMNAGVTLKQLKNLGFTVEELARAGYSLDELQAAGFSADQLNKAAAIAKQCALTELKEAHKKGVPIKDLLNVCNAEALRAAGYTLNELVRAGADPKALHQAGYTAKEMLEAGYDAKSLLDAGYTVKSLKDAGVPLTDLIAAGATSAQLIKAGFNRDDLAGQGITASQLLRSGVSPSALRQAGFSATELVAAGANAGELKSAGFTAAQLRQAGFTASQLRQAGFSAKDLRDAGYSLQSLKIAGYTAGDLLRAGFKDTDINTSVEKPVEIKATANASAPRNFSNLPKFDGNTPTSKEDAELEKIRAIQKYQQEQLDQSQKEALLSDTASKMQSQARSLMSDWSNISAQSVVQVYSDQKGGLLSRVNGQGNSANKAAAGPTFKAGTIMYSTLDTSVNSDENTPIMATIISGELKGAKLIGSFKRVDKKILLNFNLLNIPGFDHTVNFNGVAIDPSTSRTAIAGSVDNHYWLKYGTLFVASFLNGIGQAVNGGTSNCQVWNPGSGGLDPWCQTIYQKLNLTQSVLSGLGDVGQKFSGQLQKDFGDMPPTIKIPGGTAFGLLFMSDLTLPKALPKEDPLTNMNNLMGDENE